MYVYVYIYIIIINNLESKLIFQMCAQFNPIHQIPPMQQDAQNPQTPKSTNPKPETTIQPHPQLGPVTFAMATTKSP